MKLILLLNLVLLSTMGSAQLLDKRAIYFNGDGVLGNFSGGRFGINYIHKEQYSLQISYSSVLRSAKAKPYDYTLGLTDLITLGLLQPKDRINSFEFLVGKIKVLNGIGTVRFNLKGGITYAKIKEATNFQRFDSQGLTANYTFDYDEKNAVGVIINPALEFPFSRYFGLSVAPLISINNQKVAIGLGLGTMFGVVRQNPSPKNIKN